MKNFSPYTDLALEVAESLTNNTDNDLEGLKIFTEDCEMEKTSVTSVEITSTIGEEKMGRPMGTYITLESVFIKENNPEAHEKLIAILSKHLNQLCPLNNEKPILVVGLGNSQVTPDSLGPKTVDKILVTRHLKENLPDSISDTVRSVAALSPGVMGVTGIETLEVIKGIVERIQPQLVIAIDALAARKVSRINTTIQICDTGVAPGGGVGNKRSKLDKESLGVPVIAIGVPTVVDAATLANDTIDRMLDTIDSLGHTILDRISSQDRYDMIQQILDPYAENMFVTPKEVDEVTDNLANIIANGINIAIQPPIENDDINKYK